MRNRITAIILAAGNGSRMKSSKKKQFMEIKGKPLLWYSLFAFENSRVDQIIIVTGKEDIDFVKKDIVEEYHFNKVSDIVAGGKERYESVYNGLQYVKGEIVLIHDGARPFIDDSIIERSIEGVQKYDACVAGVPVKDTIKIIDDNHYVQSTPDRNHVWITQTPQSFKMELVKNAYDKLKRNLPVNVTDDAMVIETFTNTKVRFVEGAYTNIKITTPEDILLAEVLI